MDILVYTYVYCHVTTVVSVFVRGGKGGGSTKKTHHDGFDELRVVLALVVTLRTLVPSLAAWSLNADLWTHATTS